MAGLNTSFKSIILLRKCEENIRKYEANTDLPDPLNSNMLLLQQTAS